MKLIYTVKRFIIEGKRPKRWRKASKQVKKEHPYCSICYRRRCRLEAHDMIPYRDVENRYSKTVKWWKRNMMVLCREDHKWHGHYGDYNDVNEYILSLKGEVIRCREIQGKWVGE